MLKVEWLGKRTVEWKVGRLGELTVALWDYQSVASLEPVKVVKLAGKKELPLVVKRVAELGDLMVDQ